MDVVLMGMGRLGRSLAELLSPVHKIRVEAWRRGTRIPTSADVYWICVPDHAIAEVAQQIPTGGVVLHASGASTLEVLAPHKEVGSLHPLQSFPGPEHRIPDPSETPVAVAGTPHAKRLAWELGEAIGFRPFTVEGDRRAYHAAAVIAGNFATLLLDQACLLLQQAGVDPSNAPEVLSPLMRSSLQTPPSQPPLSCLTGPLVRGDTETVAQHLDCIGETSPEILEIYKKLSETAVRRLHALGQIKSEELETWKRLLS